MECYFAYGENTHTLRLTSELVDLRVGYAKWIRRARLAEPHLTKLRKYDACCCIILTESYRSGHNEAVLKTVWEQSRVGSNPTLSAKAPSFRGFFFQKNDWITNCFFLTYCVFCDIISSTSVKGI